MASNSSGALAREKPETQGKWISITGKPLELDVADGFLGRCLDISQFEKLNQLGEGTYGVVYRASDTKTSRIVALKQVRIPIDERQNGIPITALREMSILRSLKHANIVNVFDVAASATVLDEVYMVMEYAEQLLEGLEYLHRNDIIHRDIKMQNLLLTAKGVLKIADFGMAREYSSRPLTPGVVTIWYRAPELLLGTKRYNSSIDMWSTGLILAEFLLSQPCLTGESPLDQLSGTVKLIGSPSTDDLNALSNMGCPQLVRWQREGGIGAGRADNLSSRFAAASTEGTVDFLRGLLTWDPRARWTASEALSKTKTKYNTAAEKWWKESPRATEPALLPTFPEIRNGVTVGIGGEAVERDKGAQSDGPGKSAKEHGYVFDFGGESTVRPGKRRKGHI